MINFKDKDEIAPSLLILLSICLLLGALIYMLVVPMPSARGTVRGRALSEQQIKQEIRDLVSQREHSDAAVKPRLGNGNVEAITSALLAQLTHITLQHNLKLAAFRPERPQVLNGVTELQYSVQVSGAYSDIRKLLALLDVPDRKAVLRSVQITSTQGQSGSSAHNTVSATLGLSAYMPSSLVSELPSLVRGGTHAESQ